MNTRPIRIACPAGFPFVRRTVLALSLPVLAARVVAAPLAPASQVALPGVTFDSQFLRGGGSAVDVSRFSQENAALPGDYQGDIYVNQAWQGRGEIRLREQAGAPRDVQPCFDRALLERIGVSLDKLSRQASALLQEADRGHCVLLPDLVPNGTARFDNGEQRLDIGIPQIALSRHARDYVPPRYWDDGVPAAMLQYSANAFRSETGRHAAASGYLAYTAGLNAGPWRLRHIGNVTREQNGDASSQSTHAQSLQTYIQRSLPTLLSQLTIGDATTDGAVFGSVGVRGVQLASDERMLPMSQRGFAPTVRGMANSNAKVQIRQNGNIIYETIVAPGAFEIDDLYDTGYGGDLEMIVTEADGSRHSMTIPYASQVNALRPGVSRFGIVAGQYRNGRIADPPRLLQLTGQHGFSNRLTGYGGLIAAQGYRAWLLGTTWNIGVGAVKLDVTQARTRLANQPDRSGASVALAYSNHFTSTGTSLTLAGYRYSASGFLSLVDAMSLRDQNRRTPGIGTLDKQKGRFRLAISQHLGQSGDSLYLSGSAQNYWNRTGRDTQYQAGYNTRWQRASLGVVLGRNRDVGNGNWFNSAMLSISLPLGTGRQAPYATTTLQQRSREGGSGVQQNLSGTLGEAGAFNYAVAAGRKIGGDESIGGNVGYRTTFAALRANASRSSGYRQFGAELSGTLVAWDGGIAFSPQSGDTIAVIEAHGAAGARLVNGTGQRIDPWGRAAVTELSPFEKNAIELDTQGLPLGVQLKSTLLHAVPTAGAVVRVRFDVTDAGPLTLLRAKQENGKPLPFGAEVFDQAGKRVGVVAQAGRIMAYGLQPQDRLTVKWGDGADRQCRLHYALPAPGRRSAQADTWIDAVCQAGAGHDHSDAISSLEENRYDSQDAAPGGH